MSTGAVRGLRELFLRDIDRLRAAVEAYPDEASVWLRGGELPNAGGTLALHLAGNLRHFIGATLGRDGYVRDREREFAARDLSREVLVGEIAAAREAVATALSRLDDDALGHPWPGRNPLGEGAATGAMLAHLYGHLNYHLGQLDYHRRGRAASGGDD